MNNLKRNTPLSLLLGACLAPFTLSDAWGVECSGTSRTTTFPLPATLTVPRDAPNGTILYDTKGWQYGGDASVSCTGSGTPTLRYGFAATGGAFPSGLKGVYETNVPGVGIKVAWHNSRDNLPDSIDGGTLMRNPREEKPIAATDYTPAQLWWIQLIKIGNIGSGTFRLPAVEVYYQNMLSNRLEFPATALNYQRRGCVVKEYRKPVPMGYVYLHDFSGIGSTAKPQEFSFDLVCDPNMRISYEIYGFGGSNSPALWNNPAKGMATGVGVELLDGNGERVPQWKRLTFGRSGPVTGDLSMPFTARYYQVAEKITPGPMQVPAVLTLFYE
ncbi:fimbrial protein [Metapseudomonas furukawaii]|uniref:Fimbrial adhesin n=1 Tax=Metapseudomonas furukawaii TaxID=1149133 RepID=A0AAD1FDZ3_METFU|nr:fimbrial protein [Pseudomonas furukawaii]ELS27388.1 Fimbrial protein [Pseudomonas furukawaii]BAU72133.1 fimbrial adhesin [Pseudomonas furukawaii]